MDLLKYNIHFGFKNDEISIKDLVENLNSEKFINHFEYEKNVLLDNTIYKILNKVPIHIIAIRDYKDFNKFRIIKGCEEVSNILTFLEGNVNVKIGNKDISYEQIKDYFLQLSFLNISYVTLNEEISLTDEYIEIIDSLLEIL